MRIVHIDLFSGIGGFAVALKDAGFEIDKSYHSDIEKYPLQVYSKRFPESIPLGDVTKINWKELKDENEGKEIVITGGFPCQPHSVAGKRKASEDERDLWSYCVESVRILQPRFALFENVRGLLTSESGRFFSRCIADLADIRYDAEWTVKSAASVGAPHRRERIWIVAYPTKL